MIASLFLLAAPASSRASTSAVTDSLTWTTLPGEAVNVARNQAALVFDSRRNRVLAFCGGVSSLCFSSYSTKFFDDVRAIDPSVGTAWDSLPPGPGRRPQLLDVAAVYDSTGDRILMFGGVHPFPGSTHFPSPRPAWSDTLWSFDCSTNTWSIVPSSGSGPSARSNASLSLDPLRDRLILFGGRDSNGVALSDLWTAPRSAPGQWSLLVAGGAPPPGRSDHLAAYDPGRDRLLIVGGSSPDTTRGTWSLSLAGSPAWTPLTTSASTPTGVTFGGLDARRGRLFAVGADPEPTVRVLDLASNEWFTASPAGQSPRTFGYTTSGLGGCTAVFDPVHDGLVLSWIGPFPFGCWNGITTGLTHVLRSGPLGPASLTAAFDSVEYFRGVGTLHWSLDLSGTPSGALEAEVDAGAGFGRYQLVFATESGPCTTSLPLSPATAYRFRLRWFDGTASRTTSPVDVQTPPAPARVSVAVDSIFVAGGSIFPRFLLTSDSLQLLTPTVMEYRMPGGSWQDAQLGWPLLNGWFGARQDDVPPNTLIEYRLRWGPVPLTYSSVYSYLTPPVPVFDSSHVEARQISLHWHSIPGATLSCILLKSAPGGKGWPDTSYVQTDAQGRIDFVDRSVAPSTFYNYQLDWLEGGIERTATTVGLATPADSRPVPLALASPAPNPAANAFDVRLDSSNASSVLVELYDVGGRRRWSRVVPGGPQVVHVAPTSLRSGVYSLVVRQAGKHVARRVVIVH